MDPRALHPLLINRRQFFDRACTNLSGCLGLAALGSLINADALAGTTGPGVPHFAPKARRIIYLFAAGAPSQIDTWDYKPGLADHFDEELPESIRNGQRITTMTTGQSRLPVAPSKFAFNQHGQCGTWVSELLPWTSRMVDDIAVIKTVHTEAINHDPAITFFQTGAQQPGRPSLGAWLSYGLGSVNRDLPGFVVLHSSWTGRQEAQALFNRLWGSGFLPSEHQGVQLRANGDPVLYLTDPPGVTRKMRRSMLDRLAELNEMQFTDMGDPETNTRIAQYEMAYRMQASVPDLVDMTGESEKTFELYGEDSRKPGTFAANCLLARRLAERDVRCIQIYHRGWDQHGNLPKDLSSQCRDIDQASYALVTDLKQRGLLDDTLVVWGGEFGRTVYCQGKLTKENYGRDHHPRCFSIWMAGGGIKSGIVHGETDEYSYNVIKDPVHVHDLQATILHLMGLDHKKMTYRFQGRDFRLTDVHGRVVSEILA
jgi:hypothetical protein